MNCIKQFIIFLNIGVNPLRLGIKDEPKSKNVMFT